ncbi:radical SAM family heme chaperone HemW [Cysteiniphilum sp. 6C5]|uniref:radical SAM family heme chaperone HemW n=1 Tax=unclassified Cysteiniphilum TaxID=2610889 RepID=UPI003F872FD3
MLKLPPLSLYIHFPWCVRKCPYCDFNSHHLKGDIPAQAYLDTLLLDLQSHAHDLQGRQFDSIFLGGGTPSLFPSNELSKLFEHLSKHQLIADHAEITIEANPGTIEHGKFSDYKAMGINRISLGVQSLQNDKLKTLGRIHNAQNVYNAVNELTHAGFDNFNIDLMHGLPDQSVDDALFDLREALALNPTHLSWYQLTLEPNTAFAVKPPKLPDEDLLFTIEQQGKALIQASGFTQYETSAYCKDSEYQAKHNLNYWQFGDYIGIGAGAHGKITLPETGTIRRHWKRKNPKIYMQELQFPYGASDIATDERPYEFMLNALRLQRGFSISQFEQATGLSIDAIASQLNEAIARELLKKKSQHLIPTELGQRFLNDLLHIFLP